MPLSLGVAPIHDLLPPASDITLVPLKSIFFPLKTVRIQYDPLKSEVHEKSTQNHVFKLLQIVSTPTIFDLSKRP